MACANCAQNCGDKLNSDKCVLYTGPDIPLLGITTGDTLYSWEAAVVEQLTKVVSGTGITLSAITIGCVFLTDLLEGKDKTLANLIQLLIDGQCALRALIPQAEVVSFNLHCLTSGGTPNQVIQSLIDKVCELNTRVAAIEGDYVKASQLNTLIDKHLQDSSGNVIQWNTRMIPGVPLPYTGDLSNFDSSGKGLVAKGYDKVYLMNGMNGTVDARGRSFIGANIGIPGGSLDAAVNPALSPNTGINIGIKTKLGEYKHANTLEENGPHSHGVTDPGHAHNTKYTGSIGDVKHSGGSGDYFYDNTIAGSYNDGFVVRNTTGITVASSGSGAPHNNIHPSIGCAYIIYIP